MIHAVRTLLRTSRLDKADSTAQRRKVKAYRLAGTSQLKDSIGHSSSVAGDVGEWDGQTYGSEGWGFESLRAHSKFQALSLVRGLNLAATQSRDPPVTLLN